MGGNTALRTAALLGTHKTTGRAYNTALRVARPVFFFFSSAMQPHFAEALRSWLQQDFSRCGSKSCGAFIEPAFARFFHFRMPFFQRIFVPTFFFVNDRFHIFCGSRESSFSHSQNFLSERPNSFSIRRLVSSR